MSSHVGPTGIEWSPVSAEVGLVVTVSGPQGFYLRQEVAAGETARFGLFDEAGGLRPSGSYVYELRPVPQIDEAARAELAAARESGWDVGAIFKGARMPPPEVQDGAFAIQDGAILMGGDPEPGAGAPAGGNRLATKDQVIPDDLIVQGSICAGFDCVNNENFGFDTIRLKENNTRIQFDDTSSTTGFPTNNWQIRANSSASGGQSFLAFVDQGATGNSESGTINFQVTAGAPANSLVVASTGRVGLRTGTPVLDLHIATSNTPGMRLEQTSAGGFTAQTWDVAGNEANFFVRSVTTGSQLPFRIRPGAPSSSIDISASGNVGIGTASPARALHVVDTGATDNTVLEIQNDGPSRIRLNNSANGEVWNIGHQSPSGTGLVFSDVGDAVSEMFLDVAGNMTIAGTLTQGSSRAIKVDFDKVESSVILEKIRSLPILTWTYKDGEEAGRHVGPMAEDFHAAFGLGADDRHIAPSDQAGLALVAIQGLMELVQEKDHRIGELEVRIQQLEERLIEFATNR